jgi:hypothetical protein
MKSRNILTRLFETSSVWLSAIISPDEFTFLPASTHYGCSRGTCANPRVHSVSWHETQSSQSGVVDCRLAFNGEIRALAAILTPFKKAVPSPSQTDHFVALKKGVLADNFHCIPIIRWLLAFDFLHSPPRCENLTLEFSFFIERQNQRRFCLRLSTPAAGVRKNPS